MESFQALPGTYDLFPAEAARWDQLRLLVADLMGRYQYGRIETPLLEQAGLFTRSVGTETDIVQKEMYAFDDRGGRRLALRPEGTAGVVRAFVERSLHKQRPYHKFWYWGPMFRAERPQKGRYRQFWQFGVETFGIAEPSMDAEQIALATTLAREAGLGDVRLRLNSLGNAVCRPAYKDKLLQFLGGVQDHLCESCRERARVNPLRVLDCKEESCQRVLAGAPVMLEHLCADCRTHLDSVRRHLDASSIPYEMDGRIVRGLDYYVRTAFELDSPRLGAQSSVLGGGRYDGLVETLGGPNVPGVGWAAGIERVLLASSTPELVEQGAQVYIASFPETLDAAFKLSQTLRGRGRIVEMDHLGRSLKAQLKEASRMNATWVIVLGPEEWAQGKATLKNMSGGSQDVLELGKIESLIAAP